MTDEKWARVRALFETAAEQTPAERDAFLAAQTAGDHELRREVESLLAFDEADVPLPDRFPFTAEAVCEPHSKPGDRIGAYEIIALIGAGAMGEVYSARDMKLKREVALKILPSLLIDDPDRLARFRREAQMLAALNHVNIAAIHGLEETAGAEALVLELVEGPTLADRIAEGPIALDQALPIARQIAEALEVAHDHAIVHRDLKPANVKVRSDGVVKVLDFGLAKALAHDEATNQPQESASADLTHEGIILGTAAYMSPEQAKGLPTDKRTDIWAFGCVLFEMLAGRRAFSGETVTDLLAAIVRDDPDWAALPPDVPPRIRTLLRRCLRKDPRQRLQAIGDARIEIDAIDEEPAGAPKVETSTARAAARRAWLPWAAVAALAASVALWEANRPATQENPLTNARFSRITDWGGIQGDAEISPDGKFVAFISDRAGEFDIWLSQLGTGEFRNLTADVPALSGPHSLIRPFGFYADGSAIWFSVTRDPVLSKKMVVPLSGGTPRPFLGQGDAAPAWSSDGTQLALFRTGGDNLLLADRTGGDARQIPIAPADPKAWAVATRMHNHNPIWSTDDRWLYFVHGSADQLDWTDEMDIWRVRPSGGSPERLTHQNASVTFLAPLDDRTLLYVARSEDGSGPWLWALDVRSRIAERASLGLEQYTSVAASHDGRRVVATTNNPTASLWAVPILERLAEDRDVEQYAVPTVRALRPRFGGASLFYLSARGTADGLWRYQNGQATEVRNGSDGALFESPAVSRDGSRVAVVLGTKERRRRLAIMSADGTGLRGVAEAIDIQGSADWSPDGSWIVTGGSDAQGPGLFKIPIEGGAPIRLLSGQATNPVWSPDGNLIVYAGALVLGQVAPLLAVRPDGTPVELPALQAAPGGQRFLPDGRIVYMPRAQKLDFWLLDPATKQTRRLTDLSLFPSGQVFVTPGFDVIPDGKRIVFDRRGENSEIVLIELPRR